MPSGSVEQVLARRVTVAATGHPDSVSELGLKQGPDCRPIVRVWAETNVETFGGTDYTRCSPPRVYVKRMHIVQHSQGAPAPERTVRTATWEPTAYFLASE